MSKRLAALALLLGALALLAIEAAVRVTRGDGRQERQQGGCDG